MRRVPERFLREENDPGMRRLRKLVSLDGRERRSLIYALCLLSAFRLGLWLVPFRKLLALVSRFARVRTDIDPDQQLPVQRISWAVTAASRYVPMATCLTQALAGRLLFAQQGYAVQLHIGVDKGAESTLEAHAWLTWGDQVVMGTNLT